MPQDRAMRDAYNQAAASAQVNLTFFFNLLANSLCLIATLSRAIDSGHQIVSYTSYLLLTN